MYLCKQIAYIFLFQCLCLGCFSGAEGANKRMVPHISEQELDLYCLKLSYPQIKNINRTAAGPVLELKDGQKLAYNQNTHKYASPLDTDLQGAMAQPYPLEPLRPDTPQGFAPGRKRPYYFLESIYGADKNSVQSRLSSKKFMASSLRLNKNAGSAFENARPELLKLAGDTRIKPLLHPDGAYYWRKIAGETAPSAHSYGIAIDLGANVSPYWRWSRTMPHPKQKTYPAALVEVMERHGYIWGGKWHEYDLMHFEYRPELICKANMLKLMKNSSTGKFPNVRLSSVKRKLSQ